MKRMTKTETQDLLRAMTGVGRDVVEFMAHTGCRVSEALQMRVEDVDESNATASVPTLKRRKAVRRDVVVDRDYAKRLASRAPGRLFGVTRQGVWKAMRQAARAIGLDPRRAHPHALRHGFAIRQVEAGVPVPVLRKWLGHASLSATLVYVDEVDALKWKPSAVTA